LSASDGHQWARPPDPSPEDIGRAGNGDAEAFRLIVERYQGMVYSIAYNVLGDPMDAEDAAQEAFLRCYRKLGQYRSEASFSTWLYRLAMTAAIDYKRREGVRSVPGGTPELAEGSATALGESVDASALVAALRELPDDYRVPTVLRDVCGLPYQEISELTARPLGTVKAMVHRGRAALRLRLRAAGARPDAAGEA
jgi:RNA polymerase sigma-70 factor, ECF subfamily